MIEELDLLQNQMTKRVKFWVWRWKLKGLLLETLDSISFLPCFFLFVVLVNVFFRYDEMEPRMLIWLKMTESYSYTEKGIGASCRNEKAREKIWKRDGNLVRSYF